MQNCSWLGRVDQGHFQALDVSALGAAGEVGSGGLQQGAHGGQGLMESGAGVPEAIGQDIIYLAVGLLVGSAFIGLLSVACCCFS